MKIFDSSLLDRLLIDDEARRRIATDLDHNLFVEAGAGTGKTTVLVDRVVNLFASGALATPGALVAITFTEAAASELRNRIRTALEEAMLARDRDPSERARCAEARRRIDEAVITTLHGFAQRILAEHPLEAGLPPRFQVDDGVMAGVRFVERWDAFLDDLYDDSTAANDLLTAHALGLTSSHLLEIARRFHERWDQVVGADLEPRAVPPPVDAEAIVAPLREALGVAGERVGDERDKLAVRLADFWYPLFSRLQEAASGPDEFEVLRAAAVLPSSAGQLGRGEFWGSDKATITGLLTAACRAAASLTAAHRCASFERLLPRLADFTRDGVRERRFDGVLEFHDLLVHARDLLAGKPAVRASLAARYGCILIDEFQDTDPLQLDIAFLLSAADPAVQDPVHAHDTKLAEGKLLIVGDPKQSIYAFRGADISVWDDTRELFGDNVLRLAQNFRTVPTIIEWVNEVFAEIIGEGRPRTQPAYLPLAAAREPITKGPSVVLLGGPRPGRIDELRTAETHEIARLVKLMKHERWLVTDPRTDDGVRELRYDDIAVLLPTRTSLGHLERALDVAAIPYRIESRSLVWATDAVRELLAVMSAIDDPSDDAAVVAALRSPGFACSDVELLEWRAAGGSWDHRRQAPDGIAPTQRVALAMTALNDYHEVRNDQPVDLLVERVVRELHLVELTFAQRRPRDHWRRLRFVLDQARAFVEAGGHSLGELLAWADLQTQEGAAVIETPAPEADDDAVRILTIHGSKGLEFPVVVLTGLGTALRTGGPEISWTGARPEVAVGRKESRFLTAGFEAAVPHDGAAADEGHRLLYVAATRARDHLVVGLTHSPSTQSHARVIWAVAADEEGGRLARLARRIATPEQLELDLGEPASPAGTPPAVVAREQFMAEHEALVAATHVERSLSPTGLAGDSHDSRGEPPEPASDDEAAPVPLKRRRGATAVGRAVHGVLQAVELPRPDENAVRALAAHLARAEGVGEQAELVAELALSSLSSPTVREAAESGRHWRELPLLVPLAGERTLEGYVDLLYEDAGGDLVLVDHKTDLAPEPERYRLQLGAYAYALERALGRPVARAVLVFSDPAGAREVVLDDVPAAVGEVRALLG